MSEFDPDEQLNAAIGYHPVVLAIAAFQQSLATFLEFAKTQTTADASIGINLYVATNLKRMAEEYGRIARNSPGYTDKLAEMHGADLSDIEDMPVA